MSCNCVERQQWIADQLQRLIPDTSLHKAAQDRANRMRAQRQKSLEAAVLKERAAHLANEERRR